MAVGMPLFGLLIVLPISILLTYVPGRLILAPLKRAALDPRPRVQFRMTEILMLTAQIGVLGALLTAGPKSAESFFLFIITMLLLVVWWLAGVRWLSHAGVTIPSARLWTLAVAVPLAFGVLPGLLVLLGLPMAASSNGTTTIHFLSWQFPMTDASAATVFRVIQISALTVLLGHIPLCRWIVRRALRTREAAAA